MIVSALSKTHRSNACRRKRQRVLSLERLEPKMLLASLGGLEVERPADGEQLCFPSQSIVSDVSEQSRAVSEINRSVSIGIAHRNNNGTASTEPRTVDDALVEDQSVSSSSQHASQSVPVPDPIEPVDSPEEFLQTRVPVHVGVVAATTHTAVGEPSEGGHAAEEMLARPSVVPSTGRAVIIQIKRRSVPVDPESPVASAVSTGEAQQAGVRSVDTSQPLVSNGSSTAPGLEDPTAVPAEQPAVPLPSRPASTVRLSRYSLIASSSGPITSRVTPEVDADSSNSRWAALVDTAVFTAADDQGWIPESQQPPRVFGRTVRRL